ncbi:MAG: SbtA family thio(seleno)oxazole RiPP natural product precursor [Desulfobacterales bacterium]|nr:SbtA family thio(seleno)oxazole RiPP natural product precursor [Desulfobacterales bacterium]
MDQKELKKILAGFCAAGLLAGSSALVPECLASSG